MPGCSAIGLQSPKFEDNIGGVLRAAFVFEASMVAISGDRAKARKGIRHDANTVKAQRHVPTVRGPDLRSIAPYDFDPVAVDILEGACHLHAFRHPKRGFYIFGPEDGTLSEDVLSWCKWRVMIPSRMCLNLAAAVNVVLYDRQAKGLQAKAAE